MLAYDCIRPEADVFKQWWYSRRLKTLVSVVRIRPWVPYPRNYRIFTLTSFLPLGLFRPCSRSEKRTQTTSELTCYFLLRPLLHVC